MMKIEETTVLDARQKCTHICPAKSGPAGERWLVAQAKSGHSGAFGELYERHRMNIYCCAFRMLRNRQDAEDAVQRSFQKAFTNLRRFREDCTFSTWVTRIGINEAVMLLRQRRATIPLSEDNNSNLPAPSLFDTADSSATPQQAAVARERGADVMKVISCLRESLRTVILLREFRGLTTAETARQLGLTVSAVKARTHNARRYLRQRLERKYNGNRDELLIRPRNNTQEGYTLWRGRWKRTLAGIDRQSHSRREGNCSIAGRPDGRSSADHLSDRDEGQWRAL